MVVFMFLGINEAQSSVMLPQLRKAGSNITVTRDEETWIASLGFSLSPVIAVIIGPLLDVFGRKRGLQFFYLNAALGYAVIASARGIKQIFVGRIICGLGIGQITVAVVYLAEICTVKQREYMLGLLSGMFAFGVTLACSIGGYLHWDKAAMIYSVTATILFIAVCFIPESPAWLARNGKEDASARSFQMLGRRDSEIKREVELLKLQRKNKKAEWATFLQPTVWKPFFIMSILYFLQSASGIFDLLYYSVDFIESLGTKYDPLVLAVILATTRLITCCTVVLFFRSNVRRKLALAISCFGMAVSFSGIGVYEYLQKDVRVSERSFQWIPIAFLLLYMISSPLGMLGLPSTMNGEVYPLQVRGIMAGTTTAIGNCFMFLFVKTYHVCFDAFKVYGLVFFYGGFSFVGFLFAIFILPKTHHKSLYEIELSFLPKEKRQMKEKLQIENFTQRQHGSC